MTTSITFEDTDANNSAVGGSSNYTFSLTVGSAAGQERLVVIATITDSAAGGSFAAMTVDGQTATKLAQATGAGGTCSVISFWRAAGTSGTSISVVATRGVGGTSFSAYCAVWTLSNAGTLLAFATSAARTDPTLSLNTAASGVAAAAYMGFNLAGASTAWTGLTENFDSITLFSGDIFSGASSSTSAATPRTVIADISGTFSDSCASVSVSFNPPATGTTLTVAAGSYALMGSDMIEHLVMPLGAAGE